ncbi:hypothetical protein MNEG_9771, partial [Monoraphidium neglectum]
VRAQGEDVLRSNSIPRDRSEDLLVKRGSGGTGGGNAAENGAASEGRQRGDGEAPSSGGGSSGGDAPSDPGPGL